MQTINKEKTTNYKRILHYFWQECSKQKTLFWALILSVPLRVLIGVVLQTYIFAQLMERFTTINSGTNIWSEFGPYIILFIACEVISGYVLSRFQVNSGWKFEAEIAATLQTQSFEKLDQHSMTFHNDKFSGSMVSAVNKYASAFERMIDELLWGVAEIVSVVVLMLTILFFKVPIFALCLLAFIIPFVIISDLSFRSIRKLNQINAEAENTRSGRLADMIGNIATVKSYGQEKHEETAFSKANQTALRTTLDIMTAVDKRNKIFRLLKIGLSTAFILFLLFGIKNWGIGIATAIIMFTYTNQIVGQLWRIPVILRGINRNLGDASEMVNILDESISVQDDPTAQSLKVSRGLIEFDQVTFTHANAKAPLFKDFNLRIKPGERIGLVGRSGSGKTTLTKLLLRFADVERGTIKIDNQDLRQVSQNSLRTNIAYVPQETLLFHRSVCENIAYGKTEATHAEVKRVAEMANAWEFIKDLPQGLDTLTGERGVKLSGGQRQRVAIARAILKNAPILVLDEATASLDSESEKLIQDAMKNLMQDRTCLVVAHRLSTIANLDRIVVLDNGKIVEQGTHLELLNQNGVYANLWKRQSGGFIFEEGE